MKTYDFSSQFLNLCVCGDIHGEFKTLIYNLKRFLPPWGKCGESPEYKNG